jgi:hypothetical protein
MHAYRITRGGDVIGIRARRRRDSAGGAAAEGLEEEGQAPDLLECPDHRPSTFLKGKPRSIIRLP